MIGTSVVAKFGKALTVETRFDWKALFAYVHPGTRVLGMVIKRILPKNFYADIYLINILRV
jgi:hypothetical protein